MKKFRYFKEVKSGLPVKNVDLLYSSDLVLEYDEKTKEYTFFKDRNFVLMGKKFKLEA